MQKYYWPEDTCTARQWYHRENEVFISDQREEFDLEGGVRKIKKVVVENEAEGVKDKNKDDKGKEKETDEREKFVCRKTYEATVLSEQMVVLDLTDD